MFARAMASLCYRGPMSQEERHHRIDYIELTVTNMERAQRFYREAFSWEFKDYGPDYCGIQGGDREMGGLCVADKVVSGGPLVVLYSNELEATLTSVEQAGGEITKAMFEFPGGRRFHFRDPSGNELAVWSMA